MVQQSEPSVALAPNTTRLLLLRHGQTDGNFHQRLVGVTDTPLNETGRRQAHLLGRHLANTVRPNVLYASTLSRAQETAHIVREAIGHPHPLNIEPDLREMDFGEAEGLPVADLATRFPQIAPYVGGTRPGDPDWQFPGGDWRNAYYARAVRIVEALAERHPGETVAAVTHGGIIIGYVHWLRRRVLGYSPEFPVENCSITELHIGPAGVELVRFSDTSHLQAHQAEVG